MVHRDSKTFTRVYRTPEDTSFEGSPSENKHSTELPGAPSPTRPGRPAPHAALRAAWPVTVRGRGHWRSHLVLCSSAEKTRCPHPHCRWPAGLAFPWGEGGSPSGRSLLNSYSFKMKKEGEKGP